MTIPLNRGAALAAVALALCAAAPPSQAEPGGPLRVILPVGAGSAVDTIMRAAQGALSKALGGQAVVIENLPGAGGITGTQALVKAAPDGNTIAVLSNNHAVNPSVFKKLPYDSLADITPISVVGSSPFVLLVNPAKLPVKNAKDLQAMLKARPDAYNYGSSGNGTIIHLAGEMFVDAAGVVIKHIPYKGMGPMLADLIGGQVEMGVAAVPAAQGHLKSGALTAIGVMGRQR
jgi:tripartite-type tricarboxylate transporter receptor subunit TctC